MSLRLSSPRKRLGGVAYFLSGVFLSLLHPLAALPQCAATTVLTKSFNLDQVISYTGTSAFVPVNGSSSMFTLPCSQDVEFRFDFWFYYSSGPSTMMLDLRFVLDGVPTDATRFPAPFGATPELTLILHSVLAGSHTLTVEVRSVLANGPPTDVTLCGNRDCNSGGTGTAKLEVDGVGTPSYTLTVVPSNLTANPAETTTATITITPAAGASGYLGSVTLSRGGNLPSWIDPDPVSSTGTAVTSKLMVAPRKGTNDGTYTVTVTAQDANRQLPANGAQSVTVTIGNGAGGGDIALLTFAGLVALWIAWSVLRAKRAVSP
jgi:hypothetical protein